MAADDESYPSLPATSWAVLGRLPFGEELTGNDLKKLEELSLVRSHLVADEGVRGRRPYGITEVGLRALRNWSRGAGVDMPVHTHIDNLREQARRAARHADRSESEPGWAFTRMSLRWSQRYFEAEIALAEQLLEDIHEAAARYRELAVRDENDLPVPRHPGIWRTVREDSADG